MRDLPDPPRWSKTAIVVVLVVFSLVLGVAIFALWVMPPQGEQEWLKTSE